jgi:hypothetical protein
MKGIDPSASASSSAFVSDSGQRKKTTGHVNVHGSDYQVQLLSAQGKHHHFFEQGQRMVHERSSGSAQVSSGSSQSSSLAQNKHTPEKMPLSMASLNRMPGGRYEHLGDFVAGLSSQNKQDVKAAGSSAIFGPERVSSETHKAAFATDLQALKQWSELEVTSVAGPKAMGFSMPKEAAQKMLADAKKRLDEGVSGYGLSSADFLVHSRDKSILKMNMNHIEFEHIFSRRERSLWQPPSHQHSVNQLSQKADQYMAAFKESKGVSRSPLQPLKANHAQDVFKTLLQDHQGIVIGEEHGSLSSKSVLATSMKDLKKMGVNTLFMEHLCADSHSKCLDEYMHSPKGSPMPKRLAVYLDKQTEGNIPDKKVSHGFKEVVAAAKDAGMKVVPIDTAVTYETSEIGGNLRIKMMNYYAAEKIRLSQPEGKWIAFVGSGHATENAGVPGLDELTGTRSVVINDQGKRSKAHVETNVKGYMGQIDPDVVISYKVK